MEDNCPICNRKFIMRDILHTFCSKKCKKKNGAKLRKQRSPEQPMMKWATRQAMLQFNQEKKGQIV